MASCGQMKLGYALLPVTVVVLLLASAAHAKTINVTPGHSIQAAINAAVKGDVVVVAKGTYKENIDFKGKAITVQSSNPTDKTVVAATIIDGQKKGSVVTFKSEEKATSVLKGFTITNGTGTPMGYGDTYGGGVWCDGASPTVADNVIHGNDTLDATGLTAGGSGGGVYCGGGSPTLVSNTISGNGAANGGGIDSAYSAPVVASNVISGNSARFMGGGMRCQEGSPTLTNNTLVGNSACGGGGVYSSNCFLTLTGNVISRNSAADDFGAGTYGGGGVFSVDTQASLMNNTISGNSVTGKYGRGGGVSFSGTSLVLGGNTISGNTATQWGGGVYCTGSTVTLSRGTISGNAASLGGGLYCDPWCKVSIRNTVIALSGAGGGIYASEVEGSLYHYRPSPAYSDVWSNTGGNYVGLPNQTGKNGNISKNPLFYNAAAGNFHEKSKGGRWDLKTKSWVIDAIQSPCIDAGDPASAFANESAPNGGRINMGAYGNTPYASKSAPASVAGGLVVSAAAAPASGGGAQLSVNLSAAASVEVTITNLAGRPVAALPESDLPQGVSTLAWSGKGTTGLRVPAGTYLLHVTARTADGTQAQALSNLSLSR